MKYCKTLSILRGQLNSISIFSPTVKLSSLAISSLFLASNEALLTSNILFYAFYLPSLLLSLKINTCSMDEGQTNLGVAYSQRWLLYIMHFCFAFVSRMWDMGVALLVAELTNNSLFFVAAAKSRRRSGHHLFHAYSRSLP